MWLLVFGTLCVVVAVVGLIFVFKEAGWPSELERNNTPVRALRTGVAGTVAVVGTVLLMLYFTAPEAFVANFSALTLVGVLAVFGLPLLLVSTVGSYVHYMRWSKTEKNFARRLRELTKPTARGDD